MTRKPRIGRVTRTGTYLTEDGVTSGTVSYGPARQPVVIRVAGNPAVAALSADRLTLVIKRRVPVRGVLTTTLTRAVPFTEEAITLALSDVARAGRRMQVGQRNRTRRVIGEYGTLWWHVMLGPPTWWKPKLRLEPDGTVMAGWLRAAVAVRYEQPAWLR